MVAPSSPASSAATSQTRRGSLYRAATYILRRKKWLLAGVLILFAALQPQRFINLWLSPDQQGRVLFELGYYSQAAQQFQTPLWQGMSLYGAEQFVAAARLFSQYPDANGLLAEGNALAHGREYVDAVQRYQQLLDQWPQHPGASHNIAMIQAIIDENTLLSESQVAEAGDLVPNEQSGPRSSEGDERQLMDIDRQQSLSADQLLQDPALTQMWMRQVQRDPSEFLSVKFYMQLEQQAAIKPSNNEPAP